MLQCGSSAADGMCCTLFRSCQVGGVLLVPVPVLLDNSSARTTVCGGAQNRLPTAKEQITGGSRVCQPQPQQQQLQLQWEAKESSVAHSTG
jgi:hypothetical protein